MGFSPSLFLQRQRAFFLLVALLITPSLVFTAWPAALPATLNALSVLLRVVGLLLLLLVAALSAFVVWGSPIVARYVKSTIEACDRTYIGVDVTIESLTVSLRKGILDIRNLVVADDVATISRDHACTVVANYPGYSAEYLMKIDRAVADVNMALLLTSCFREIEVERLIFKNVDVIWEKSGITQSNVKEAMQFASGGSDKKVEGEESPPTSDPELGQASPECAATSSRTVSLRMVKFEDVGVKMASHLLRGTGLLRLALADIDYEDFSAEHGSAGSRRIVRIVLLSILKTIVANTAGKSIGDKWF